jgi:outer membrane receptor protein involved in Fe transport
LVAIALGTALLSLTGPAAEEPIPPGSQEIVVTGERIPRSLRETSSSVFVATQSDIEGQGAEEVDQLLAKIPNVQLGNGSQGPAIRGMDTTGPLSALPAFLGGNRPRVALIVDGRPTTYSEFVFGAAPLWDVARVEVFRSPQTTTQGQNSIAGAIFVNSNEPSATAEFRARAIVGDFHTRQLSLLGSGPLLGDDVAFRVAGDFRYSRTTSRIDDVMRGADPNHDVYGLLRAKLLVDPMPGTRMLLTYVHSQSQAPQTVGVSAPFRKRRDDRVGYGLFRINVDSLTAAVEHKAGEDLTARLLLSAGDSQARRFAIANFGETRSTGRDWTGEALLNWSRGGALRIVGGLSHNHVALKQFIDLSLLSGSIGRFSDWQDGTGVFGDASLALSPRATVTAGIRYQRDRQKRRGALTADPFEIPVDFIGTFDAWLPKLTLGYELTSNLRIGAMVQKAYNPGGTTIRVDTSRADNFEAETLWDYELFARGSLLGGALKFETNLFYYDMENAQRAKEIRIFTPSGRRVGFADLFNVPKARTYGAEGQLRWQASPRLSASMAIGLLRTKVIETDSESIDLKGNEFDRSPRFTGSAAIDWRPTDRLRISAHARHRGPYYSDPENSPAIQIKSGTTVDGRAHYRIGRYSLFAQVRNVFNAFNLLDLSNPLSGEAEDPRRISVGIESDF